MKSISRTLAITIISVLLISLLAACNNPIGSRSSNGSGKPQAPAATQAAQPNPAQVQPAAPNVNAPSTAKPGATNVQSDPHGDEIEQSLNDLTTELDATDTLDDLK